jgi:RNA-directed DNA polymerase
MFETKLRTVPITTQMVELAYRKVKSNKGSAGIDKESLEDFQTDLSKNLYKIWNRLSSGSYFPQPVREVTIPKSNGGERKLGIPTVSDRIAQQVVKAYLEPRLESEFHSNSYGYRPLKSAHDALGAVRTNVREYSWVLDMDIKSFFDEVDHELLMKALDVHVAEKWVKMYIQRWLEVPSLSSNGDLTPKQGKGTPQGGVISPLLANLYLHYTLDKWLDKTHPEVAFVRYADDVIVHCHTQDQAETILGAIRERLRVCHLRLNEKKTKLVYCKDYKRSKRDYPKRFGFLGFTFKPRTKMSKDKKLFLGYDCAISQESQKRIIARWKHHSFHRNSTLTIQEIAHQINPQMRGLIRYYGKFCVYTLRHLVEHFHFRLVSWVLKKYKRFKGSFKKAYWWLRSIKRSYPTLFYHWTLFKYL